MRRLFLGCIVLLVSCTTDESPSTHVPVFGGNRIRCYSRVQTDSAGAIKVFATPQGLGAADLQDAYKIDATVSPGATIAIVDAYGYSNLQSDLATYRSTYGLGSCTTSN